MQLQPGSINILYDTNFKVDLQAILPFDSEKHYNFSVIVCNLSRQKK